MDLHPILAGTISAPPRFLRGHEVPELADVSYSRRNQERRGCEHRAVLLL